MENTLGEDIPVGIYRTGDKIKNLKIGIKLRKISNACFIEKDSLSFGDSNELELVNLMKASMVSAEKKFIWQEKVEKTEKADDNVEREPTDHRKDSVTIHLFSYTDVDILSSQWKNKRSCTFPASHPSHLEEQIGKMQPQMRSHFPDAETWQKPIFSNVKRIVKERSSVKGTQLPVGQSMIIMAALFFDDGASSEEIELCLLQVDDHGTLTVIPDFSKRKSYTFVNSRSETFEYEIENVSNTMKISTIQREKYLMKKIALYKRKLKEEMIGDEFNKPAPGTLSFTLNCEIVSAQNFSSLDIFAHYLFIIPKGWDSENSLEGTTQTCQCKLKDGTKVAYFGYTFSLDITTDIKEYKEDSVKVIFEITSIDYWGNFRNEGYGYVDIALVPGTQIFDIYTWKIEPTTLRQKLHNFFIGGMPHLEDLSYIINPRETKAAQLSKYGVQTISSGTVTFKSFIFQQKTEPENS